MSRVDFKYMVFSFCFLFLATAELLALGFVQAEIDSKDCLSQGVFNAVALSV